MELTIKAVPSHIGCVWIELILLKLKTENWKHCSKIIFKCVNSAVGPNFNEKIDKKWNLWVHEQCIRALFIADQSKVAATVAWTVAACGKNAWKKKKKKKENPETQKRRNATLSKPGHRIYCETCKMLTYCRIYDLLFWVSVITKSVLSYSSFHTIVKTLKDRYACDCHISNGLSRVILSFK